ncbi:Zinc finger, C3HC4 type (RING finger) [Musa troglodytarum]|uniref:Zinc finger, C3HC4 type (RING finger) n=1 Tax=Musa troglodytarum TaxID=320322 RepID=A0A9E7J8R8_9LILI|nr:Zinc finger, C3HC4 type (RING finger) [Musa troglodytarum]URD77106.1 Zinc finger, C3HC4 type (RING finger) [Musa troglodytarum]
MMSSNDLALMNPRGGGRYGYLLGTSSADHDRRHPIERPGVPHPLHRRPVEEDLFGPWRLFEERVRTGPFGLTRFPLQPHSPVRILMLQGGSDDRVNPGLMQFVRDSLPRIRGRWHLGHAPEAAEEDPGLTEEEFKKAMKKLKQQVYNPPNHRKRTWKRGLFGSRTGGGAAEGEKDDGKDCTVCLEAFVANEPVLVTPCNHMFHRDCLEPWVRSHGKCPVCRFVLCERRENALVRINDGGFGAGHVRNDARGLHDHDYVEDDDLISDIITLIRAMEEAFGWIIHARAASYR